MKLKTLTRLDLDGMSCATPGCDHTTHDGLFIRANCHPRAAIDAEYREGLLRLRCAACKQPLVNVKVAHPMS